VKEIPDKDNTSAIAAPAWRSSLQHPGFILGIGLAAIIPLGVLAGFLRLNTVFARGSSEIIATDPGIKVVFSEAVTDDPPHTQDPGHEQDVAYCRARVKGGASLSLSILNGYPGYACTLQTTLENRGQGVVRLRRLEYDVPTVLAIQGPEYPQELVLAPGQRAQQDFSVVVQAQAKQNDLLGFQIQQVFAPDE
jgi:hypothetical protein